MIRICIIVEGGRKSKPYLRGEAHYLQALAPPPRHAGNG